LYHSWRQYHGNWAIGFILQCKSLSFQSRSCENIDVDLSFVTDLWQRLFLNPTFLLWLGSYILKSKKAKLDSAFTIFYLGINVGATMGQFLCPWLGDVKHPVTNSAGVVDMVRDLSAFKWGFLAAGCAMATGTISFFFLKNKYIVTPTGAPIGGIPDKHAVHEDESTHAKFSRQSVVILISTLIVTYFLFQYVAWDSVKMPMEGSGLGAYFTALAVSPIKTYVYPFIYAAAVSLGIFILTDSTLTKVETQRILVLYIVAFFVIFFWSAFEQSGSSLTFIADKQTDTNILGWNMPPSMVQIFNGIFHCDLRYSV
jgi:POT family proton-dependent oligopeptide transporter